MDVRDSFQAAWCSRRPPSAAANPGPSSRSTAAAQIAGSDFDDWVRSPLEHSTWLSRLGQPASDRGNRSRKRPWFCPRGCAVWRVQACSVAANRHDAVGYAKCTQTVWNSEL